MGIKLTIEPVAVPLTQLENGTWRVTGTRIPLERIVECHKAGDTPEEIVESFDVLKLSDVYLVVAYYLEHTEEVEEYMREQDRKAEEIRKEIEASQPPGLTREVLLARKARMDKENARG
jgi:uncharacterized protein (DUF433 family)